MATTGAGDPVWEISTDQPRHHRFSPDLFTTADAESVVFVVGSSDPRTDWPRIHPGPLNAFTGYRELIVDVRFELADPAGWHWLEIEALESNGPHPDLLLDLNGARGLVAVRGRRDDRSHDPIPPSPISGVVERAVPIPPGLLLRGPNRLAVRTVAAEPTDTSELGRSQRPDLGNWFGSALQWVRLALRRDQHRMVAPGPSAIVEMTPLFVRSGDNALDEVVEITVRGLVDLPETSMAVSVDGHLVSSSEIGGRVFGDVRLRTAVPDPGGSPVRVVVSTDGPHQRFRSEGDHLPARKWTVHLLNHVHLDIGYTDHQAKITEVHSRNIDKALTILERTPDWRFSVDGSFVIQQFMRSRDSKRSAAALQALREGRMSVNAFWALHLTGVAALEDLYRAMYFSSTLSAADSVPIRYANLTDVPSYTHALPSVLRSAGIDSFFGISNHMRGGNIDSDALHLRSPVRWRGPDGSEVLAFFADLYTQLRWVAADPVSIAGAAQGLTRFLSRYDRPEYLPTDLPLVGTHSDNEDLSHGYADLVQRWHEVYAWPRLRFSTMEDYLRTVRPLWDQLPELVGDGGSYWEDGVGAQAIAVAEGRSTQARLPGVEGVTALVTAAQPGLRPDIEVLDQAWQSVLLLSEHTWTAAHALDHPHSDQVAGQLDWKVSRVHQGHGLVQDETRRALSQLAEQVTTSDVPSVVVVNPLSRARDAVIEVEHPDGMRACAADGTPVPSALTSSRDGLSRVRYHLGELPPFGYRLLPLRPILGTAAHHDTGSDPVPGSIDTPHYRVGLDPVTGGIDSLVDKASGAELLDSTRWRLGDVLHVEGGGTPEGRGRGDELTSLHDYDPYLPPPALSIETVIFGPTRLTRTPWSVVIEREGSGRTLPRVHERIEIHDVDGRVELQVEFDKQANLAKESVYVVFPFTVAPTVRFDRHQGWVDPSVDHHVGACNEWFTVQNCVVVGDDSRSIAWSSADAPLFAVSDVVSGRWPTRASFRNGTILSWVMNNYWWTNIPAEQSGRMTARYAFRPMTKPDLAEAYHFGQELRVPSLVSDLLNTDRCDDLPRSRPMAGALYPVQLPDGVKLTLFAGRGDHRFTIRLQELVGEPREVELKLPLDARRAWFATATEQPREDIPLVAPSTIRVRLGAYTVETIGVD